MSRLDKFSHFIESFVSYFNVKFSLFWSVKYSPMALWVWHLPRFYILLLNMYIPHLKSLPHLFLKIYLLRFFMEKRPKIHIIMVCNGCQTWQDCISFYATCTYHIWNFYLVYFSKYIRSNAFFIQKTSKIQIILVCKLCIYRAIDLKLVMLVYIITQNVHVHFQVSIALPCENILYFVILYHKNCNKWSPTLVRPGFMRCAIALPRLHTHLHSFRRVTKHASECLYHLWKTRLGNYLVLKGNSGQNYFCVCKITSPVRALKTLFVSS